MIGVALSTYLAYIHKDKTKKIYSSLVKNTGGAYKALKNINRTTFNPKSYMLNDNEKQYFYYNLKSKDANKLKSKLETLKNTNTSTLTVQEIIKLRQEIVKNSIKQEKILVSLKEERKKMAQLVIGDHMDNEKSIRMIYSLEKKLKGANKEEKKILTKQIKELKSSVNINVPQTERIKLINEGKADLSELVKSKKIEYSNASNEDKKQLASELLNLIEKDKNINIKPTETFEMSKSKVSENFTKKSYAILVKEFKEFKKGVTKKFSQLDKEIEDIHLTLDATKKTMDRLKYTENNDTLRNSLMSKFKDRLTGGKIGKASMRFLIPLAAAIGGMNLVKSSDTFADVVTDLKLFGHGANIGDEASIVTMSKVFSENNPGMNKEDANEAALSILRNTPRKDVSKVFGTALALSHGNVKLVSGTKVGLFQLDYTNPLIQQIILGLSPDSTSTTSMISFLQDPNRSTLVFNKLREANNISIDKYINTLPKSQKEAAIKEANYNVEQVGYVAEQIAYNDRFNLSSNISIDASFGENRKLYRVGDTTMKGVRPGVIANFGALIKNYKSIHPKADVLVTSGYRSPEKQAELLKLHDKGASYTSQVAKYSPHSLGYALDVRIDGQPIGMVIDKATLAKFNFKTTYGSATGTLKEQNGLEHIQDIGYNMPNISNINDELQLRKNIEIYASQVNRMQDASAIMAERNKDTSRLEAESLAPTTGKYATVGALLGGATGALFGGVGAVPGAALGALAGANLSEAVYYFKGSDEDKIKEILSKNKNNKKAINDALLDLSNKNKSESLDVEIQKPNIPLRKIPGLSTLGEDKVTPIVIPTEGKGKNINISQAPVQGASNSALVNNLNKGIG